MYDTHHLTLPGDDKSRSQVNNDSSGSSESSGASSGEEEEDNVAVIPPTGLENMSVEEIEDYRRSEMGISVTTATEDQHGSCSSNEQRTNTGVVHKLLNWFYRRPTPRRRDRDLQHIKASTGSYSSSPYSSIGSNDLNNSLHSSEGTSPGFSRVAAAGVSVNISELNRERDRSLSSLDRSDTPLVLSHSPGDTLKEC